MVRVPETPVVVAVPVKIVVPLRISHPATIPSTSGSETAKASTPEELTVPFNVHWEANCAHSFIPVIEMEPANEFPF